MLKLILLPAVAAATLWSQPVLAPVINPRGVVNAFTQQPAPSVVAPGAILWINGLNLGPAGGAIANSNPLPTELGGVQVLINNRQAALLRVDPARIVAQVPLETPIGPAQVVVRRGETNSRAARVNIQNPLPAVRTEGDKGYGVLAATTTGRQLRFSATGFGVTEPRLATGEAAAAGSEVRPRMPVSVHVGGLPVEADVRASEKVAGEFDISLTLPEAALPGDLVTVSGANRLANTAAWRQASAPEVSFLRLPANAPELRGIAGSDLRGGFLIASGARTEEGCWPSILLDLRARTSSAIEPCLTTANRNASTPAIAKINGAPLAALVGPPPADVTAGVSSKVMVFHPGKAEPLDVALPSPALALNGGAIGGFTAVLAGTPPQAVTIDSDTGAVELVEVAVGPAGGAGGAAGGVLNPLTLRVDLGAGLDKILSLPVNAGQQQVYVVVGDDPANPKRAKLAVLNLQAEVQSSRDFPEDWLPMVMPPAPPVQPGGGGPGGGGQPGGGQPGGGLPGGGQPGGGGGAVVVPANPLAQFRLSTYFDPQTRTLFVLSRKADDSRHALVAFLPNETRTIQTPESSCVAGCAPNAQILNVETSRRIVLLGTNTAEREFKQVCGALAFLVLDLATQQFTRVDLPGAGQVNATNAVADINDFLLAGNTTGDVVYALDGVTLTAYRFDLPQGITGFTQLVTIPAMEMAIATARARVNGDAGFVVFDLANVTTRQLLLPDGVASAQTVGILPATRKMVARATLTGNTGSQYVIYDLLTGDLLLPGNPEGVAFVGAPPPQPATAGQPAQNIAPMQRVNQKANTIEAITFGANRRQNGAMLIRVP